MMDECSWTATADWSTTTNLYQLLSSAYNLCVVIDKGKHLLTNIIGEDLSQEDKVHRMQQQYTIFDED